MAKSDPTITSVLTSQGSSGGDMKFAVERINDNVIRGVKNYNEVYRQTSTNLLVVAGILLAFSTAFISQIKAAPIFTRLIAASIIISLILSLAFGVVQQLMEAEFFRRTALKLMDLSKRASIEKTANSDLVHGSINQILNDRGSSVRRWASVVQLTLLGIALLLVAVMTIYFLFF